MANDNNENGTGNNPATPRGCPKGAYSPDKKTAELLNYQSGNFADPEDPLKRLSLGKKVKELAPEGKE